MAQVGVFKRQDLAYLAALAKDAERVRLEEPEGRGLTGDQLSKELSSVRAQVDVVVSPAKEMDLSFLEKVSSGWPVSGLQFQGIPVHPPGVSQKGGSSSASRVFGGSRRDPGLILKALEFYHPDIVVDAMSSYVYTAGQADGFVKRLKEQTTRACVSVKSYAPAGKYNDTQLIARLSRLLPIDGEKLTDWSRDVDELFDEITTSKVSTAGAPYWKKKPDAVVEMMHAVMPLVYEALQTGTVDELQVQEPELFLSEVRNKVDRYDPKKLSDKCRPYFSCPFHWQALFSMLSQPFTHAMRKFHEVDGCANAYGFSWANGGGKRVRDFGSGVGELGTKMGRPRFYCYGDDTDLFFRKGGVLYRVSPDFRQMDGSVDRDLVEVVIKYILNCYFKEGERWESPEELKETYQFWRNVGKVWVEFATNPHFLVDGPTVYRKKSKDGLMTGVVGTTLFDTAKSALAYEAFVEQVHDFKRFELLHEAPATKFFKTLGLTIKEGTWNPTPVREDPAVGELFNDNKFLGVQLVWEQGPEEAEPVPYLPIEDWLKLLMVPRDDPLQFGKKAESQLSINRRRFDRARGYLITGAFSNDAARRLCNALLNEVDPVAILMAVQADGGHGEKPEAGHVCGEEFTFPTSDGVPSELWCRNLYLSEGNKFEEDLAPWVPVFPGLVGKVAEWRMNQRKMRPKVSVFERADKNPDKAPGEALKVVCATEEEVTEEEQGVFLVPPQMEWVKELEDKEPIVYSAAIAKSVPPKATKEAKVLKRVASTAPYSRVRDSDFTELPKEVRKVSGKRLTPTMGEAILKLLKTVAVPQVPHKKGKPITDFEWSMMTYFEKQVFMEKEDSYTYRDILDHAKKVKIWQTPVLAVVEVARRLGAEPRRIVEEARKKGLFVLGKAPSEWIFKVPPTPLDVDSAPAEMVLRKQAEKQILQNATYAQVVSKDQAQVEKQVQRAKTPWAILPQVVQEANVPFMNYLALPKKFEKEDTVSWAVRTLQVNNVWAEFQSRPINGKKGNEGTLTRLLVAPCYPIGKQGERVAKKDSNFEEWLRVVSKDSKVGKEILSTRILEFAAQFGEPLDLKSGEKGRKDRRKKELFTSSVQYPRARVVSVDKNGTVSEMVTLIGAHFVPGQHFHVLEKLGWVRLEDTVALPSGEKLMCKKSETVASAMTRVRKHVSSTTWKQGLRSYFLYPGQTTEQCQEYIAKQQLDQNGSKGKKEEIPKPYFKRSGSGSPSGSESTKVKRRK